MKISIRKLVRCRNDRYGNKDSWVIYVSDEDAGILDKNVGRIFNNGKNWVWKASLPEAIGIFPIADKAARLKERYATSFGEAKKAARNHIKERYATWQKKSPPEQDQAVLLHYYRQLQQEAENLNLTEGRNERIHSYLDKLSSYVESAEVATDQLLLNCTKDNVNINELLDAIIGIAQLSQYTNSAVSVAVESFRERIELVKMRWEEEEIARQENQN